MGKKKVRRKKKQKDKEIFNKSNVIDLDEERKARRKEVREKAEAKRRKSGSKSFKEEIMDEVEHVEYPDGRNGPNKKSGAAADNKKPKRSKKIFVIITLIFIAIMVAMVFSASNKIVELKNEEAEYKQEIADLKDQKMNLESQISDIGSDEYIMKQARSWLKMAKEGELVYIFNN